MPTSTSTNTPAPTPTIGREDSDGDELGDAVSTGADAIEWVDWFAVVAGALNLEVEQLSAALDQGQSVAEIARANNIESQLIVNAIVDAERAMIEDISPTIYSMASIGLQSSLKI